MKLYTLFILTLINSSIFAQKVKIKDNIFFIDDSSYCKLVGKKSIINPQYSIAAMNDTELIYIDENPDKDYVDMIFLLTGKKVKLPTEKIGMFNKNILVKLLFKNNVIVNNEINEIGKNKFLAKYAGDDVVENGTIVTNIKYTLVERDTETELTISGKTIMQDGKLIATIAIKNYTDDLNFKRKYVFVLPNKTAVAEITIDEFYAEKNTFVTNKDNKTHVLKTRKGSLITQEDDIIESAVKYLVGLKYL